MLAASYACAHVPSVRFPSVHLRQCMSRTFISRPACPVRERSNSMNTRAGVILLACIAGIHAGADARGQDKFYTVIFGVQDGPNRFREAHSFATFVRVRRPQVLIMDQATISWLP